MKKILFSLIAILIGISFALVFMEIFLRINPKFGYIYNFAKFEDKDTPMLRWLNSEPVNIFRTSALFGYEHVPKKGWTNSYGLIGRKEYKLEKNNRTYRILILGDSIAAQGWSAEFLEDSLNNNPLLSSKYKFEIWNAGVGGYDVRRYYLYLKHKGLNYKPDMVLIFLFMNDFEPDINVYYKTDKGVTAYYFPLTEISKVYSVDPSLVKYSYLYRFIILKLNNYLFFKNKKSDSTYLEENGRYYLEMIKDICMSNKIPLLVLIFPYLKPLDEYTRYQIGEYEIINKVVKDLRINYLNLYEHLTEKNLFNLRDKQDDEIHPSLEGQRLNAQIIYNYMLDNYFVSN